MIVAPRGGTGQALLLAAEAAEADLLVERHVLHDARDLEPDALTRGVVMRARRAERRVDVTTHADDRRRVEDIADSLLLSGDDRASGQAGSVDGGRRVGGDGLGCDRQRQLLLLGAPGAVLRRPDGTARVRGKHRAVRTRSAHQLLDRVRLHVGGGHHRDGRPGRRAGENGAD